jgi:predicted N-formylglutamate amidohydrolase
MDAGAAGCSSLDSAGLVITCEHGGNRIPKPYRDLFHADQALLSSHRGFDPGALDHGKNAGDGIHSAAGGLHRKPSAG